jgi:hypothetical protein
MKLDLRYLLFVHEREGRLFAQRFSFEFFLCMHGTYGRFFCFWKRLRAMIPPTIHLVFRMYLINTEEPNVLARTIHLSLIHVDMSRVED